ncbi:MAG: GNAT family N-acetyltransferase [Saprospiraceae bacterium]
MTKSNEIEIVALSIDTLPFIYDFVKELAQYERAPDAVTTTLTEYELAFADGLIDGHLAKLGSSFVGGTLFYMTFSTWKGKCMYLEDFYIKPDFRQYGIGQMLFDAYVRRSRECGAKMLKWQVLDWNMPALKFYAKNNAIIETEWWNGKILFND